ncbi:hydrogen gas-evolving membrane-bound hydrogenase subunit E [Ferrimonas futtsuensis]|uniref:hydrogen gas-evolving membrane-bound hydrogenase subunit E n=1 Tax=Ferrimonas futtsuensis TaxID=364764 RepID=UPI0003F6AF46|nr:hydrogen gas-evolving membrane-bound hydrogenase subunit E [Ferrimonas futtsuensis]
MISENWVRWPLLLMLFCGIGYAVVITPEPTEPLPPVVASHMSASGVTNPVTAVLLNFRGYDTLLELAVLLVALLGVWSLGGQTEYRASAPGLVLEMMSRQLVPVLLLVAGYLLWAGASSPGGAFQAGSLLGAAGVLLLLCGWRLDTRFLALPIRLTVVAGLGVFILAGTALLLDRGFLHFPPTFASKLILMIEAAATLSIGVTLAALFLGNSPTGRPG